MKKILSMILAIALSAGVLAGCGTQTENVEKEPVVEETVKMISPLPETLDVSALENCTVAVSVEKGDAKVSDDGNMVMDITVYSYELYDMADIASLSINDVIVRKGEKIEVTEIERLESGLVHINGGEENGGFDLISNDNTVYYEIGMNDLKSYYELGKVTLPVSDDFVFTDASDPEAGEKVYGSDDFLAEDAAFDDHFLPNNTSVVIENGAITAMNRIYMP